MMDKFESSKRSSIMSKVRSKDTKPEVNLRKLLFKMGLRYRMHVKRLPGTPDIYLKKYDAIIFYNGKCHQ